ncbi:MAG: P-loop NTPase [Thermoanaerobaculum sp.]
MSKKRILTVSSGKGGVGKSTFAVNFSLALARVAPTVLVDLDTGTSSVRNTIDAPVHKDLYHFFRRGEPLEACLTTLPDKLDPHGHFRNFAFVAAPKHAMEEFITFEDMHRFRLMRAINELPAQFVVLDLRAGLDAAVLDFLPHSNSGILVFTPHHPAATAAAGDIVKALIFRKLRLVLSEEGPLARDREARAHLATINALLDKVEDVYDDSLPNLDVFLKDLLLALGEVPAVRALADTVASFHVHFVLNLFNGIRESYEKAIVPFMTFLQTYVSSRLKLYNLGWIVQSQEVHEANCRRRPIVLDTPETSEPDTPRVRLEELESLLLGTPSPPPVPSPKDFLLEVDPKQALVEQLEVLHAMQRDTATHHVRHNFAYILRRALHALQNFPAESFGQRRLLTPLELFESLAGRAVTL